MKRKRTSSKKSEPKGKKPKKDIVPGPSKSKTIDPVAGPSGLQKPVNNYGYSTSTSASDFSPVRKPQPKTQGYEQTSKQGKGVLQGV